MHVFHPDSNVVHVVAEAIWDFRVSPSNESAILDWDRFNIYVLPTSSAHVTLHNKTPIASFDEVEEWQWTPDGQYLLVEEIGDRSSTTYYLADSDSGEKKFLNSVDVDAWQTWTSVRSIN